MTRSRPRHESAPTLDDCLDADEVLRRRPQLRGDCPPDSTPCPFVSCRHHLWTDINAAGLLVESRAWGDLDHTCCLRIADDGEHPQTFVGAVLHLTRRTILRIEADATARVRDQVTHPHEGTTRDRDRTRIPQAATFHQTKPKINCRVTHLQDDDYGD